MVPLMCVIEFRAIGSSDVFDPVLEIGAVIIERSGPTPFDGFEVGCMASWLVRPPRAVECPPDEPWFEELIQSAVLDGKPPVEVEREILEWLDEHAGGRPIQWLSPAPIPQGRFMQTQFPDLAERLDIDWTATDVATIGFIAGAMGIRMMMHTVDPVTLEPIEKPQRAWPVLVSASVSAASAATLLTRFQQLVGAAAISENLREILHRHHPEGVDGQSCPTCRAAIAEVGANARQN